MDIPSSPSVALSQAKTTPRSVYVLYRGEVGRSLALALSFAFDPAVTLYRVDYAHIDDATLLAHLSECDDCLLLLTADTFPTEPKPDDLWVRALSQIRVGSQRLICVREFEFEWTTLTDHLPNNLVNWLRCCPFIDISQRYFRYGVRDLAAKFALPPVSPPLDGLAPADAASACYDYAQEMKAQPHVRLYWLQRAIAYDPTHVLSHIELGIVYWILLDYEAAKTHEQRALALEPDNAQSHFNIALTLNDIGQNVEAVEQLNRVIELDPEFPIAHRWRASINGDLENYEAMPADLERASAQNADDATLMNLWALYHINGYQNFETALPYMNRALDIDPEFAVIYENLVVVYNNMDATYNTRIANFDMLRWLQPTSTDLLTYRGMYRYQLNDEVGGLRDLDEMLATQPSNKIKKICLQYRALCLHDLERHQEAVAASDAAILVTPREDSFFLKMHLTRATSLRELKQIQPAIEAYQFILTHQPSHLTAHFNIALCFSSEERFEQAIAHGEKYLELSVENEAEVNERERMKKFLAKWRRLFD